MKREGFEFPNSRLSREVKIFLGSSISCSKDLNSLLSGSAFLFFFSLENEVVAEGGSILILITILKMDQY